MPTYRYNKPPHCYLSTREYFVACAATHSGRHRLSSSLLVRQLRWRFLFSHPPVQFSAVSFVQRSKGKFTTSISLPFPTTTTHNKDEMSETVVFCHSSRPLLQQLVVRYERHQISSHSGQMGLNTNYLPVTIQCSTSTLACTYYLPISLSTRVSLQFSHPNLVDDYLQLVAFYVKFIHLLLLLLLLSIWK